MEISAIIFGCMFGAIFGGIGGYLAFYKPKQLERMEAECQLVQGTQVDYIRQRGKNGVTYKPIYEYVFQEQVRTFESQMSASGSKYRQIGRKVTMMINLNTGKVYCKEDEKVSRGIGIIFFAIGLFVAIAICIGIMQ